MRDLANRFFYLLSLLATIKLIVETAAATTQVRQPRRKANDEPFLKIERLKKNLLHQLEGRTEGLEYLYLVCVPVHARISILPPERFKLAFAGNCRLSARTRNRS